MAYHFFQYPLPAPPEPNDLNAFLAAHRIANVTQHLVSQGGSAMLVFVVQTATSGPLPAGVPSVKPDYRQVLNEADFKKFNRLRQERKKWSEAEGVPVYTLFSNEQLAEMVRRRVTTREALAEIPGLGEARLEKYGAPLLAILVEPSASATGSASSPAPTP